MANQKHLEIFEKGAEVWNRWRRANPDIQPDLSEVEFPGSPLPFETGFFIDFRKTNLLRAKFNRCCLYGANFSDANLALADFTGSYTNPLIESPGLRAKCLAEDMLDDYLTSDFTLPYWTNFRRANLQGADFSGAYFELADFREANLFRADFTGSQLIGANFTGANLMGAIFVRAHLQMAILSECSIYGLSAWDAVLDGAVQHDLTITLSYQPQITVDNLKVAQFMYLMLDNQEIRGVIDAITDKVVLILGRFTRERKKILDAIRDDLRKRNYIPVIFDFEKPLNRDITETISTLAHMARFVIADITEPRSIPQELQSIVPHLPSVPIVPLLCLSEHEYGMYEHFVSYSWILPIYRYRGIDELLISIQEYIIDPAEKKVRELAIEKAKRLEEA